MESGPTATTTTETKLYRRRWVMLAVFAAVSLSNSFQCLQFSIISDVVMKYYEVDSSAVDWTVLVYMIVYIPFILPATWLLDKKGLRWTVTLAALGNCLAAWIKTGSAWRGGFPVAFAGQTVAAITQVFVLNVPAHLAAVWFGPDQVSTACAIGVFGNQLGNAVGFLIPSLSIRNKNNLETIHHDFEFLYYLVAGVTTVELGVVLFAFQAQPPLPPSRAKAGQLPGKDGKPTFLHSLRALATNLSFVLLFISYGINVAVYYALSTLLNQVVLESFPNSRDAGNIGLVLVLSGVVGSVLSGLVIDKTGKFKETSVMVYGLGFVGMLLFTYSLTTNSIWIVYVASGFLGFFVNGYLAVGFEFGAELTYPVPEGISSGILNVATLILGIVFVLLYEAMFEAHGSLYPNIGLSVALLLGTIMTTLIKNRLRRQEAQLEKCTPSKP